MVRSLGKQAQRWIGEIEFRDTQGPHGTLQINPRDGYQWESLGLTEFDGPREQSTPVVF
jgi:hypothetical protein